MPDDFQIPRSVDVDDVLRLLTRLESKVDNLDAKLDGVRSEVGHIRERTAVMESKLGGLEASVGDLSGRVRELEEDRPSREMISDMKATNQKLTEDMGEIKSWRSRQMGIWAGISLVAGLIGYLLNLVVAAVR